MSIAEFKRLKELEIMVARMLKRLDELEAKRKPGRPRKHESTEKEATGSTGSH